MDYDITRNDIDSWRASIKQAKPYEDYDNLPFDGPSDPKREKATTALRLLIHFGLDPYNDNDYGNY